MHRSKIAKLMINTLNNERTVFKVRYPPKTISKLVAFNMNLLGIEFIDAMMIKLARKAITEESRNSAYWHESVLIWRNDVYRYKPVH